MSAATGSYGSRGVANGGDGSSSRDTDTPAVAGRSTAGEAERTGQSSASSEASSA